MLILKFDPIYKNCWLFMLKRYFLIIFTININYIPVSVGGGNGKNKCGLIVFVYRAQGNFQ